MPALLNFSTGFAPLRIPQRRNRSSPAKPCRKQRASSQTLSASILNLLLLPPATCVFFFLIRPPGHQAQRLREITDPTSSPSATKEENPYHHLRITVTSGGCHGFQYIMSLEGASKIDPDEDTVFEGEADEAATESAGEAKVVMDEPSLELLHGSTVDYTTELIGSQFKIVDNPRATSNCGCGTSFDVSD
ncbi:hypothetical protein PDIDSM_4241 [Penicillium digitatum]|nr:hypothetical protein PDIDSM_4241 [Penicillium digitatum]